MKRFSYFSILLFVAMFSGSPLAFSQSSVRSRTVDQKLALLEEKINRLKTTHQAMIAKEGEIKQELDNLRIWIHRHP